MITLPLILTPMNIEAKKYHLIEQIMKISDEQLLARLEIIVTEYEVSHQRLVHLIKPMRKKLTLDTLIKEQNYKGADNEVLDLLISDAGIEEPLDNLLKML